MKAPENLEFFSFRNWKSMQINSQTISFSCRKSYPNWKNHSCWQWYSVCWWGDRILHLTVPNVRTACRGNLCSSYRSQKWNCWGWWCRSLHRPALEGVSLTASCLWRPRTIISYKRCCYYRLVKPCSHLCRILWNSETLRKCICNISEHSTIWHICKRGCSGRNFHCI